MRYKHGLHGVCASEQVYAYVRLMRYRQGLRMCMLCVEANGQLYRLSTYRSLGPSQLEETPGKMAVQLLHS